MRDYCSKVPPTRFFSSLNRPQIGFSACGLRDRKNADPSKNGKSSNFYGFRGGFDPLRFRAQLPTPVCRNLCLPFFNICEQSPWRPSYYPESGRHVNRKTDFTDRFAMVTMSRSQREIDQIKPLRPHEEKSLPMI